MEAVFLKIINLSISAVWLISAVMILRFALRKAPKSIRVILWGMVALRLMLPFSLESVLSLIPSGETIPQNITMSPTPSINSGVDVIDKTFNPIIIDTLAPTDPSVSVNPMQIVISSCTAIWIVGMILMLLYSLISYLVLYRKVSVSLKTQGNVYLCDDISTPFILGVIRPRIYVPSELNNEELRYVLAHERAHLKRLDHLWKPVGFAVLAVHWFNPLVWISYILLCRDIEFACDEKVIKKMSAPDIRSYSETLLACSIHRKRITACPLAFGEVGVKERIKTMLNYKKPLFWVVVTAIIACIATAVFFLTTQPADKKNDDPPPSSNEENEELKSDLSLPNYNNTNSNNLNVSKVEYKVSSVMTGLYNVDKVKNSAINKNRISYKVDIIYPAHIFTDSKTFTDLWGTLDYPKGKKDNVKKLIERYDGKFFKDKALVTVFADGFNSDSEYAVESVSLQDGVLAINMYRSKKGIDYTVGREGQLIVFEVDKSIAENCTSVNALLLRETGEGYYTQPPYELAVHSVNIPENVPSEIYTSALNASEGFGKTDNILNRKNVPIHKIKSKDELTRLFGSFVITDNGKKLSELYGDDFFQDNVLFVTYLTCDESNTQYSVPSLYIDDATVQLSYSKRYSEEKTAPNAWITTLAMSKAHGKAESAFANASEDPPQLTEDTNIDAVSPDNSFSDKYLSISFSDPLDKNSEIFTKALNADKLNDKDRKHIPIHLFKSFGEYKQTVGQYLGNNLHFHEKDFEEIDVYLLYIDSNTAENGYYQMTVPFIKGSSCTIGIAGEAGGGSRINITNGKPAWFAILYCKKGYFDAVKEFDAYFTKNIDELKELIK